MLFLNHALAARLEKDLRNGNKQLVQTWQSLDSESQAVALEMDGILAVWGGPDSPINEAVGLGMSSPVDDGMVNQIEQFYASNHHPSVIRVCPLAHSSLITILQQRAYVLSSFAYRWVLDLGSWNSPFEEADERVRVARSGEELMWARTVSSGFSDMETVPEGYDLYLDRAFFRMPGAIPVLSVVNDQPAAAGVLALNKGMAALFATSTLPSHRGHGLQTAMLDWRLRYAKENGARIATIETDPDSASQRNVERMGFRLAYVAVQMTRPLEQL